MNIDLTDSDLDDIKGALQREGHPECSIYLLTHPKEMRAKCPPCGIWFAITEMVEAKGCPKCGQSDEMEVPDQYRPLFEKPDPPMPLCVHGKAFGEPCDQCQP